MNTSIVHIPMKRRPVSRTRTGGMPLKSDLIEARRAETLRAAQDAVRCYALNLVLQAEGRLAAGYDLDGTRMDDKATKVDDRDSESAAAAD
jgi:hypothetical protein